DHATYGIRTGVDDPSADREGGVDLRRNSEVIALAGRERRDAHASTTQPCSCRLGKHRREEAYAVAESALRHPLLKRVPRGPLSDERGGDERVGIHDTHEAFQSELRPMPLTRCTDIDDVCGLVDVITLRSEAIQVDTMSDHRRRDARCQLLHSLMHSIRDREY